MTIRQSKINEILVLRSQGMTAKEISDITSVSNSTIANICERNGLNIDWVERYKKWQRDKSEQELVDIIQTKYSDDWEYLGGYINAMKTIKLKCRHCGNVIKKYVMDVKTDKLGKCQNCANLKYIALAEFRQEHVEMSTKEVAEYFGITFDQAREWATKGGFNGNERLQLAIKRGHETQSKQRLNDFNEWFENNLSSKMEIVSDIETMMKPIQVKYRQCGHIFEITPNRLKSVIDFNCKECRKERTEQKKIDEDINKTLSFWDRLQEPSKREKKKVKLISRCKNCGKNYIVEDNQSFCSDDCKRKWRNHHKDKRISKDKRIDVIMLDKLITRDKNICYICGKKCDSNDKIERDGVIICGNLYPSIDHVIPIAKGGEHSWNNVKLAHRICNTLKSDKIILPRSLNV